MTSESIKKEDFNQSILTIKSFIKENSLKLNDSPEDENLKNKLFLMIDDLVSKTLKSPSPNFLSEATEIAAEISSEEINAIKKLIKKINADTKEFKRFIFERQAIKKRHWFFKLFPNAEEKKIVSLSHFDWKDLIHIDAIETLNNNIEKNLIDSTKVIVEQGLQYDDRETCWSIDFLFFKNISKRFSNDYEKIITSTRLYLIHEAFHKKLQNLSPDTVGGIGNFPKVIEEADYQADVYAILTELAYKASMNTHNAENHFFNDILSIIEVAIETTFSFAGVEVPLKQMQIRRINRTLIWVTQLVFLEKLNHTNNKNILKEIVDILAAKPIIEVAGPKIIARNDRIFYRIIVDNPKELEFAMYHSNKIKRANASDNLNILGLFKGLSNLQISEIKKALNSFFQLTEIKGS